MKVFSLLIGYWKLDFYGVCHEFFVLAVTAVDLKQTIQVDKELQIRAYYAGHVLGAAMFYAKVGDSAIVYTGDYNMTPDKHLGAAQIDKLQLDLVITESTYATTYRDSKYVREREFLKAVHKCVASGGKVLIPTFALGRAQELCMLLDDYWERMNLTVPIYFSAGLTLQANIYYKVLINWTSQKVKDAYAVRNAFEFKNVRSFDRSLINAAGPCVLFATPGMISGGFSLEVFKQWAPYEHNLVTLPGYCVAGTIGHKLMSAKTPTKIRLDDDVQIDVRCQIHQLSFSPHTDAKGIMDLITFLSPKHVILVHGEKPKMAALKEKIESELGMQCYYPANNEALSIPSTLHIKVNASDAFLQSCSYPNIKFSTTTSDAADNMEPHPPPLQICDDRLSDGMLLSGEAPKVISQSEKENENHLVKFAYCWPIDINININTKEGERESSLLLHTIYEKLGRELSECEVSECQEHVQIGSVVTVSFCSKVECGFTDDDPHLCCLWPIAAEDLARRVISVVKNM
ncbi:cleavage and polyadenylation specificity factor subunit 3-II isoform X2 [Andrographis paniculata]|uniref:cleavage and polyadenylation specificity factor subunit 3-II isoform X2 n=1 Tax=Andrographis paniculata TaxID=175694 RepID=UPI0021E82E44|nr:cleavage and polyadenylation specificity factor subunit 3-II isoform X2 [Andrographis paniculata]